jgi:restriction endonuclease S subunit
MKPPWPTKKLGEVCDLIRGSEPGSESYFDETNGGRIRFIRVGDISGKVDQPKFVYKNLANLIVVNPNEILISFDGTPGIVAKGWSGAIASGIRVIRNIKPGILREFLFYYLQTPEPQKVIKFYTTGVTILHASRAIPHIKIPIPPIPLQQKIVERLDAIKKAQELNDKQIELTEELFQSLLHRELDPKGKNWEVKKLGEIFYRQNETVVPAKDFPSENFNYIGLENIESNSGMLINFTKTLGENIKSSKFIFRKEDILYGKLRPYLNKVWLAEFDGICSTDIWVLRSKKDCALPLVLANILRSKEILLKTSSFMTGSNLPRVRKDYFDSIKIPLPPLEIQRKIVEKLSAVQEYKKKLLDQKQKLQELFESVLNKSFKGELVG